MVRWKRTDLPDTLQEIYDDVFDGEMTESVTMLTYVEKIVDFVNKSYEKIGEMVEMVESVKNDVDAPYHHVDRYKLSKSEFRNIILKDDYLLDGVIIVEHSGIEEIVVEGYDSERPDNPITILAETGDDVGPLYIVHSGDTLMIGVHIFKEPEGPYFYNRMAKIGFNGEIHLNVLGGRVQESGIVIKYSGRAFW